VQQFHFIPDSIWNWQREKLADIFPQSFRFQNQFIFHCIENAIEMKNN